MAGPAAAIDIGSNSLLLTVADGGGRILHDEARVVGLGRGLADGARFRPDRVAAALAVLEDYARQAEALGVPPEAVSVAATSAARRATDVDDFIATVAQRTGLRIEVIPGVEEARLTFIGARLGLETAPGPLAVVDLGGGSTEIAVGEGGVVASRVSLEIGTVRATERFLGPDYLEGRQDLPHPRGLEELRAAVDRMSSGCLEDPPGGPAEMLAVAGTATTLAAMELDLEVWDPGRVHGFKLHSHAMDRWMRRLSQANLAERRHLVRVSPERSGTMLAGTCILAAVLAESGLPSMVISVGGLRHGLLAGGP